MHLQLKHDDGTRTAYFGISDFDAGDNETRLAFHSDVGLDSDRMFRTEEGAVVTGISESGYNKEGAFETIGDLAIQDETTVVVAITDRYPWVEKAVRMLEQDEDFDGDLEIIEKDE
ncbi:hypothetical protein [Halosimplex pelagicum]|uniref:Uncharacterized protein n=1 Tax=Halosimplex pelagicum TaxID=869886 RepID=A0A7D5TCR6_9EURY|nr:hypothetical protein [Halosimplex pelagicum]QLH82315.1 hypothetical protein HZS54_12130 [Halosimplex pelagicum]